MEKVNIPEWLKKTGDDFCPSCAVGRGKGFVEKNIEAIASFIKEVLEPEGFGHTVIHGYSSPSQGCSVNYSASSTCHPYGGCFKGKCNDFIKEGAAGSYIYIFFGFAR